MESCRIQPILPGLTIPRNPASSHRRYFPTLPPWIWDSSKHWIPWHWQSPQWHFYGILHFLPMDQLQNGIGFQVWIFATPWMCWGFFSCIIRIPPRVNLEPELHPWNPAPILRDSMEPPWFPFTAEGVLCPLPVFFPHFPPPIFFFP